MAAVCKCTSQMMMLLLGVFFWAVAAGFVYIGVWVFQTYDNFHNASDVLHQTYTTVPAIISICVGAVMFFVGIMSCCGAFQKNKCLFATIFVCLLLIVTFLVAASILGYVYKGEVEDSVRDQMNSTMRKYNGSKTADIDTEVDWLQKQFKCCGVNSSEDWTSFPWGEHHPGRAPASCCNEEHQNCTIGTLGEHGDVYTRGCFTFVRDAFEKNLKYIALSATAVAVVMIIGMVSTCVLFWQKRDSLPYVDLTSSGYTV